MDAFRRDGYVAVPGYYDAAEMADINGWVEEVQGWSHYAGIHISSARRERNIITAYKEPMSRDESIET